MPLTPQVQAILLLTVSLGKADSAGARPLTHSEWTRFAIWLKDHDSEPASLLQNGWRDVLVGWNDPEVPSARLEALLSRGAALGLALEKWQRAGLWVLTRADADYPERLKKRPRAKAPAALFGCGSRGLLNAGGIAVVGSRRAAEDDLRFAEDLGRKAAEQDKIIVSGGGRGIDQRAMLGALESGGTAVGVLADSLLRSATSSTYRKYLVSEHLALVTPFNPEAGFHVGNAMARNKYIYCLADAGVAVCSTPERGGTWHGAVENLKAPWGVPLWVRENNSPGSGNSKLVERGARWLGSDDCRALFAEGEVGNRPDPSTADAGCAADSETATAPTTPEPAPGAESPGRSRPGPGDPDFYRQFLEWLDVKTLSEPVDADDIARMLNMKKTQVAAWLKAGLQEKRLRKLRKPVRYQTMRVRGRQPSLLRDHG